MKFKPEDFKFEFLELEATEDLILRARIAKSANAKLEEWLKDAPIVERHESCQEQAYAHWAQEGDHTFGNYYSPLGITAKLVCIEEMKK